MGVLGDVDVSEVSGMQTKQTSQQRLDLSWAVRLILALLLTLTASACAGRAAPAAPTPPVAGTSTRAPVATAADPMAVPAPAKVMPTQPVSAGGTDERQARGAAQPSGRPTGASAAAVAPTTARVALTIPTIT